MLAGLRSARRDLVAPRRVPGFHGALAAISVRAVRGCVRRGSSGTASDVERVREQIGSHSMGRATHPVPVQERRHIHREPGVAGAVAITGIGLVTALGTTREETWRGMVAGECGVRPTTVFDAVRFSQPCGGRSRHDGNRRRHDAARAPPTIARRPHRRARRDRGGVRRGLPGMRVDPSRIGVFLGAGTGDLLRNENYYRTRITPASSVRVPRTPEPFPEYAGRRHRRAVRLRGAATLHRRGLLVEHDRDWPCVEAIRAGRIDVALAGGADVLCPSHVQRVQPAPPRRSSRAGRSTSAARA